MITKNKYSAAEQQFTCNICYEVIINPLCPFCLTTEIEAWLTLYPDLKNQLLHKLKKYLYQMETQLLEGTNCFKCGKRASICPYCFAEYVLKELKNISASNWVLKEFHEFFNFDSFHDYKTKN